MNKKLYGRFIFLIVVGCFTALTLIYQVFGNEEKVNKEPEDLFADQESPVLSDKELKAEKDIEEPDFSPDNGELKEEDSITEEQEPTDYGKDIIDDFGEQRFKNAKSVAEKIVVLLINEDTEFKKWESLLTVEALNTVKENLIVSSDGLKREIDSITVYPVKAEHKNEIKFEIVASWYLKNEGKLLNKQKKLYYVTVSMNDNKELVQEVNEL